MKGSKEYSHRRCKICGRNKPKERSKCHACWKFYFRNRGSKLHCIRGNSLCDVKWIPGRRTCASCRLKAIEADIPTKTTSPSPSSSDLSTSTSSNHQEYQSNSGFIGQIMKAQPQLRELDKLQYLSCETTYLSDAESARKWLIETRLCRGYTFCKYYVSELPGFQLVPVGERLQRFSLAIVPICVLQAMSHQPECPTALYFGINPTMADQLLSFIPYLKDFLHDLELCRTALRSMNLNEVDLAILQAYMFLEASAVNCDTKSNWLLSTLTCQYQLADGHNSPPILSEKMRVFKEAAILLIELVLTHAERLPQPASYEMVNQILRAKSEAVALFGTSSKICLTFSATLQQILRRNLSMVPQPSEPNAKLQDSQ